MSTNDRIIRDMRGIDPHGPAPTDYDEKVLWEAMRAGKPPQVYGGVYAIPTDYHERVELEEEFERHKAD